MTVVIPGDYDGTATQQAEAYATGNSGMFEGLGATTAPAQSGYYILS